MEGSGIKIWGELQCTGQAVERHQECKWIFEIDFCLAGNSEDIGGIRAKAGCPQLFMGLRIIFFAEKNKLLNIP